MIRRPVSVLTRWNTPPAWLGPIQRGSELINPRPWHSFVPREISISHGLAISAETPLKFQNRISWVFGEGLGSFLMFCWYAPTGLVWDWTSSRARMEMLKLIWPSHLHGPFIWSTQSIRLLFINMLGDTLMSRYFFGFSLIFVGLLEGPSLLFTIWHFVLISSSYLTFFLLFLHSFSIAYGLVSNILGQDGKRCDHSAISHATH